MRNLKVKIGLLAILLIGLNNITLKADYSVLPTYLSIISSGTNSYFTELVCTAQFLKFNEAEMNLDSNMEMDASLELENWMMETQWSEGMEFINESELQIESWMTDFHWIESSKSFKEPDLKMESWMSNPVNWNVNPAN